MSAERPINADVPSEEGTDEEAPRAEAELETTEAEAVRPEAPNAARPEAEAKDPTPDGDEPKDPAPTPDGDEPRAEPPAQPPESKPPAARKRWRRERRPRRPVPGALKLIAGLVAVAIGFIVLVVVAGGGGGEDTLDSTESTPATPLAEVPAAEGGGDESESEGDGGSDPGGAGLGFPLLATDNTTRIGGAGAAEVAAAAALSVFPSISPSQRPAAVTLVDESEWQTAVAGAVLMAPPIRAPLLYTTADGMPAATEAALGALAPAGGKATKGTKEFVLGEADRAVPEDTENAKRIRSEAGVIANVADVAILRDQLVGAPPEAVIVAPLESPDFAVPAAAWAARSGDPVLFAERDRLPEPTVAALKRHRQVPVYVLGPESAISNDVVAEVEKLGPPVERVSGSDPVRNAIAFARYADGGFGWGVNDPGHGFVLARAGQPLDVAAAAPLSAAGTWGPLLLTDGAGSLPPELRNYFLDVKPGYTDNPTRAFYNHVWVVGDSSAIDVGQQAEVNELAELAKIGGGE